MAGTIGQATAPEPAAASPTIAGEGRAEYFEEVPATCGPPDPVFDDDDEVPVDVNPT
jgi:hypothetical protein